MEAGLERDVVVVETVRVEFYFGSGSAAAEEVDDSAFADHLHRLLPGCGDGDCFDGNIDAAILRREAAHSGNNIFHGCCLYDMLCAENLRGFHLLIALHHGY